MKHVINQYTLIFGVIILLGGYNCNTNIEEDICFKVIDKVFKVSNIEIVNHDTSTLVKLNSLENHLNQFMCNEYFEMGGDTAFSIFSPNDLYEQTVIMPVKNTDRHLGVLYYKFPTGQKRLGIFMIDLKQRKISNNIFEIDQWFCSYARGEMKLDTSIVSFYDLDNDGQSEIIVNRIGHNGTAYTSKEYIYLTYDESLKISSMFTFEALIDFPFKTLNRKVTVEDKELILKTFDQTNNDFIGEVIYIKKDNKFVLKDSLVTNQYLLPKKKW